MTKYSNNKNKLKVGVFRGIFLFSFAYTFFPSINQHKHGCVYSAIDVYIIFNYEAKNWKHCVSKVNFHYEPLKVLTFIHKLSAEYAKREREEIVVYGGRQSSLEMFIIPFCRWSKEWLMAYNWWWLLLLRVVVMMM